MTALRFRSHRGIIFIVFFAFMKCVYGKLVECENLKRFSVGSSQRNSTSFTDAYYRAAPKEFYNLYDQYLAKVSTCEGKEQDGSIWLMKIRLPTGQTTCILRKCFEERVLAPDLDTNPSSRTASYYEGVIFGKMTSFVHGWGNEMTFDGVIKQLRISNFTEKLDIMYSEPCSRYCKNCSFSNVLYKMEDYLPPHQGKCSHVTLDMKNLTAYNCFDIHRRKQPTRPKRLISLAKPNNYPTDWECLINVYIDHLFVKHRAAGIPALAIREASFYIKESDTIFSSTDFNDDNREDRISLKVAKVEFINELPGYDYNQEPPAANNFLFQFQKIYPNHNSSCVNILFTYQPFGGAVLGVAYLGQPFLLRSGIFTEKNHAIVSPNIYGADLPRAAFKVTVTHEIGHLFGSGHDPTSNLLCTPQSDNGLYIMAPKASSGLELNNLYMSDCTKERVRSLLVSRADVIWPKRYPAVCGNAIVEEGEICDCGSLETCQTIDPCCVPRDDDTPTAWGVPCQLRLGRACSHQTQACCEVGCTISPAAPRKKCSVSQDCKVSSYCDGVSSTCPPNENEVDGESCNAGTKVCKEGKCQVSMCELYNMTACFCEEYYSACHLCCKPKDQLNGTCRSLSLSVAAISEPVSLPVGSICFDGLGFCNSDKHCVSVDVDLFSDLYFIQEGSEFLFNNWLFLLSATFVFLAVLVVIRCYKRKHNWSETLPYRSGVMSRIYFEARRLERRVSAQLSAENAAYKSKHKGELNFIAARNKLMTVFSTVSQKEIELALINYATEDMAVDILLLKGYPMTKLLSSDDSW